MSATTTDLSGRRRRLLLAGLLLIGLLGGCAEEPLPQRRLRVDDCLQDVHMDQLKQAIARCDRVVKTFPRNPLPLNERFVLHTLAGDDRAACRDIALAAAVAARLPAARVDPLLREDLKLRQASCRETP